MRPQRTVIPDGNHGHTTVRNPELKQLRTRRNYGDLDAPAQCSDLLT